MIKPAAITLLGAWMLGGCAGSAGNDTAPPLHLTVFAAASLTDSFNAAGESFRRQRGGVILRFNYAGTPTLVTQIEQGAHADVFASADTANMDRLQADGLTGGAPQVFAHNQLEIVVAPGNPKHVSDLSGLARRDVLYISEAPTVPAGKYSLQALQKAGVSATPRSLEADVKSVVSKIELGEADAGIVYATDVSAAGNRVQGVPIPAVYNVVATYPIVVLKGAANAEAAGAFVAFLLTPAGQALLVRFGFQPA